MGPSLSSLGSVLDPLSPEEQVKINRLPINVSVPVG